MIERKMKRLGLSIGTEIECEKLMNCLDELYSMSRDECLDNIEIEELTDEEKNKFFYLRNEISKELIQIVKKTKKSLDFVSFELIWNGSEFWKQINKQIQSATSLFLQLEKIREMEETDRINLYKEIFIIIYTECENAEYACEKLAIDSRLCILFFHLNSLSENAIYNQRISKRRFGIMLEESCGLGKTDAEEIWNMFNQNREYYEKVALSNRLFNIEKKLKNISERVESVESNVDSAFDLLLSMVKDITEETNELTI